ncbi:hypothetical protein L5515_004515 [Caenorhabditis briggsae]|uniref:Apple domain-containing protein n=1 Tax=Caenorhabditis briggsae TaxID=6238 RepID=A0AAE9DDM1_CAEBR|nr:hypothetical protein L3Y34_001673 [Caenorhabditis briggsae]UMM24138.1 hypothetical protein L5515_004515 [Caenorhabditis briggsae]
MLHTINSFLLPLLLILSSFESVESSASTDTKNVKNGGAKPPNLKLLECFEFKKNYWIVGHAFHTSSVQFKDECLRMCLTSSIRKAKCLSAMHVPNDDECVISDQNQVTKPDLFIENDTPGSFTVNFFRNICVDPPDSEGANRFEARLQGYKGGEGIIELAQTSGRNTQVMVVISGLKENSLYEVALLPGRSDEKGGKCHKKARVDGEEKTIMTLETDHTGMAVEPWRNMDLDIFEENVIGLTAIVVENSSRTIVDCGPIRLASSSSSNSSSTQVSSSEKSEILFFSTGLSLILSVFLFM